MLPFCFHALIIFAFCLFLHLVTIVPCLLTHLTCFHTLLLLCLAFCLLSCLAVIKPCFLLGLVALVFCLVYSHTLLLLHLACFCTLLFSCFTCSWLATFTPYFHTLLLHALLLCLVALLSHLVTSHLTSLLLRLVVVAPCCLLLSLLHLVALLSMPCHHVLMPIIFMYLLGPPPIFASLFCCSLSRLASLPC